MTKIEVKETIVKTIKFNGDDYLSITDIAKLKNPVEPKDVVKNWMRSKNTLEYLSLWEMLNNPDFRGGVKIDPLLKEAGSNAFTMSPSRWKEWRDSNPELKGNIRDYASINQLICLSNMENLNAVFINDGLPQAERLEKLNKIAISQMQVLENIEEKRLLTDKK